MFLLIERASYHLFLLIERIFFFADLLLINSILLYHTQFNICRDRATMVGGSLRYHGGSQEEEVRGGGERQGTVGWCAT